MYAVLSTQNPWWEDSKAIEKDPHLVQSRGKAHYLPRSTWIAHPLKPGDFHTLRGPRQVGKTTLVKEWISRLLIQNHVHPKHILYISCEGIETFSELRNILESWLTDTRQSTTYVFLDEVSFIEKWQQAVLYCFNAGLLQTSCLVVTGSNARDLKESSERFPGRRGQGKDILVFPLTPQEYRQIPGLIQKSDEELIDIFFRVGGFPHAIKDYLEYGMVTDTTYQTYRNWIIGDASRFHLSEEFLKQILYRISETLSSRLSWNSLIETTTIKDHSTALSYVEHLADAFLCHIHYFFDFEKLAPDFSKARKLYFIDPLLHAVGWTWKPASPNIYDWYTTQLQDPNFKGKILENILCSLAHERHPNAYFWYSAKTKKEIDLVLYDQSGVQCYEAKLRPAPPFKTAGKTVRVLTEKDILNPSWER
jgi:predicted AAA+ superfamily ATPase